MSSIKAKDVLPLLAVDWHYFMLARLLTEHSCLLPGKHCFHVPLQSHALSCTAWVSSKFANVTDKL